MFGSGQQLSRYKTDDCGYHACLWYPFTGSSGCQFGLRFAPAALRLYGVEAKKSTDGNIMVSCRTGTRLKPYDRCGKPADKLSDCPLRNGSTCSRPILLAQRHKQRAKSGLL